MDVQPCSRCGSDEVVPGAEERNADALLAAHRGGGS